MKLFSILSNKEVKELLDYTKKYVSYQKTIFILAPILLIVGSISPFLVRFLFDNIIQNAYFSKLPLFVLLFIFVKGAERFLSVIVNYNFRKCGNLIVRNEQTSFVKKILRLPVRTISGNNTGDILSRATSDIPVFSQVVSTAMPGIVLNVISLVVFSGILIYLSWQLAIVVFATIPFYNLSINSFNRLLKNFSKLEREKNSEVIEGIRERIEGALTIKRFGKFDYFVSSLKEKIDDWVKVSNKYNLFMQSIEDFLVFIKDICPIIVLSFGGYLVMKGNITLGTLVGFYSFMNWIYEPIRVLSHFFVSLQSSTPVFKRIKEVYEIKEETSGKETIKNVDEIEFKGVDFSYNSNYVLKNLNFKVTSGERVAIAGLSGSGKSTMLSLMTRFYEPTNGSILINKKDIKRYTLESLRKNIIVVKQNDFLFNMSVKENIILDGNFSEEEFIKAVKIARVDKFVNELENGYKTLIGERGKKLSDGQRQRIAIARAIIRKPQVLVLDEATSGIDSKTEEEIFENLFKLDMTIVIVSHRLSTIKKAGKIFIIENGQFICDGTHEELLNKCSKYKQIIQAQLIS
ncbi:ABC transporter [Thermosipho sp. 1063]|uniref:ABC transporter ATP-binding protein n=1 Tax=unclassified Thermosipho (in: thermotogales) TaxID=2676525 RepID=UPI0009507FDD|nr:MULTISPECIES: ABC transporter ATP-binding protein [unclassified Thermosipho (in: thermotogales)]APT72890.1 ABC transporter [Thermosipho sp. 1063]OOC42322.1 ABC transporter [Thermosipho sp. 1074]